MEHEFAVTLTWQQDYTFEVDFEKEGIPPLITDEPPPLGDGSGPNPVRLLAAAVGNCMSASLKFCLERARLEVQGMTTRVEGTMVRNERGRMRVASLRVHLAPTLDRESLQRMGRCLDVFEDFCIVAESVKQGVAVTVEVEPVATETAVALSGVG
jgi:uncharacterized OsmC-like protein